MDYRSLIQRLDLQYNKGLPFVVYSHPESNMVTFYFQKDNQSRDFENFEKSGFVFAPFEYEGILKFISEENSDIYQVPIEEQELEKKQVIPQKSIRQKRRYLNLLVKTITAIKQRKATKIVISRSKLVPLHNFSLTLLASRLFSMHSNAFRYIWYHPETSIWCGATPEILVQTEGSAFNTMALAGTQLYTGKEQVYWSPKEIDEQQLVSDSITNSLQRVTSVLKVSKTQTYRSGSLLHIKTNITGVLKNGKATLATIAAALHPTPAVCGSPQKAAKEFILRNEGYKREFYTGFLGPINGASSTLMVNLRCMKVTDSNAELYVGGGITLGSDPEAEWNETENKLQPMLQVLQPMV